MGAGSERGRCGGGAFGRNWRHADEAGDIREIYRNRKMKEKKKTQGS